MKQRDLFQNQKITQTIKSNLVLEAQKDYMLSTNESLKDQRTDLFNKIAEFYQNEYCPTISKHAKLMTLWNKLNIALVLRGTLSESDIKATNELLDKKLREMFNEANKI